MELLPSELWRHIFCTPSAEHQAAQAWVNSAGHYISQRHFMHRDINPDTQIAYCVAGAGLIRIGSSEFPIRVCDCFVLPRHVPHTYYADHQQGWDLWWMHFGGSYAEHLVHYAGFSAAQPVAHLPDTEPVTAYFSRIIAVLEAKPLHAMLQATSELLALLLHIKQAAYTASPAFANLVDILDYRADNLDTIAASMGYTKQYFIRRFQQTTGITPWRYILHLKIDKAKELLLDRRLSIQQVAHTIGMRDANYFSRSFKQHVGVSPKAFRTMMVNQRLTPLEAVQATAR